MADAQTTARRIARLSALRPKLAFVLGSGFQPVVNALDVETEVPFDRLPGFPHTSVSGHAGRLLLGRLSGTPVIVLSGRAHFYEGHDLASATFPIRVLAALGVRDVLLTNAAGGISRRLRPGDFMAFTDHINLMGANPLRGPVRPGCERFVDLTRAYDRRLTGWLRRAARGCGVKLQRGVYLAVSGPSYETPAEIRAFARLGADAVGMSTVPEAIVARQCGLNVAALSCITNLAAGRTGRNLSHAEVLETGARVQNVAVRLLETFAKHYGQV
jgi:purine-nucleoside phosphorylase